VIKRSIHIESKLNIILFIDIHIPNANHKGQYKRPCRASRLVKYEK